MLPPHYVSVTLLSRDVRSLRRVATLLLRQTTA